MRQLQSSKKTSSSEMAVMVRRGRKLKNKRRDPFDTLYKPTPKGEQLNVPDKPEPSDAAASSDINEEPEADKPEPSGVSESENQDTPTKDERTWYARMRNKFEGSIAVDRVLGVSKTVLEVGSDAADILVELGNGVTVPGVAALTMRGVNTLRELRTQSPAQYFSEGWKPMPLRGMDDTLHEAFAAHPGVAARPVPGMSDYRPAYTADLDGIEFGWAVSDVPRSVRRRRRGMGDEGESRVTGAWIREGQAENDALHVLGRCVWKHLSSMRLLARNVRNQGIAIVPEPEQEILPSRTGDHLYETKLRGALERKINRSVFLIGEAGIGKSCLLRYVASIHGGLQLRFKLADMHGMSGTEIADIVEVLRPDVLLIDDFDRLVMSGDSENASKTATAMLDPLEQINKLVPLFIVSANYNDSITEALLRPGRFDEMIVMDGLEPELYVKMLPGAPEKLIAAIQRAKMPMAHVVELRKRAEACDWDWEAAKKELRDLADRSNSIIELSYRSLRRRKRKKRRQKLAGKSQRQKAAFLERDADSDELKATRYVARIDKLKARAEKQRESAKQWREKAEAAEIKDKAKKAEQAAKQEAKKAEQAAKKEAKKAGKKKSVKVVPEQLESAND